jgi:acyl-CoA synthetase (AMP-forming)/AMP-acid ligase II
MMSFISHSGSIPNLNFDSSTIMAPAQVALPAALPATPSPKTKVQQSVHKTHLSFDESSIQTVDALVRHRARSNPHATIVAYPSSGVDFVEYSMQQLDVFAYRTARHYQTWIPTRNSSSIKPTTVALLGPSNLDYLVTMLALTKLGHTVLFLSTRISQMAVESLIETTGATHLIADASFLRFGGSVKQNISHLEIHEIASQSVYDFPVEIHADTRMDYQLDSNVESLNNIYIIHSSGTCSLPTTASIVHQTHTEQVQQVSPNQFTSPTKVPSPITPSTWT